MLLQVESPPTQGYDGAVSLQKTFTEAKLKRPEYPDLIARRVIRHLDTRVSVAPDIHRGW